MRGRQLWTIGLLVLVLSTTLVGCAHYRTRRPALPAAEPGLDLGLDDPAASASVPVARPVTVVDRHPLLSKPREYYEISGDNKLVKVGAATFIGVPAGILGEMRQIVVGQPAPVRY